MNHHDRLGQIECDDLEDEPAVIRTHPAQQRVTTSPSIHPIRHGTAHHCLGVRTPDPMLAG